MPDEEKVSTGAGELQPILDDIIDALHTRFQLSEMYGTVLASMIMFHELLPALVQTGILTGQQVEAMLTNASKTLDLTLEAHVEKQPGSADRIAKAKARAQSEFADLRKSLMNVSHDPQ